MFSLYLLCLLVFNLSYDYSNLNKILTFSKYSPGSHSYFKNNFIFLNYENLKFKYENYLKKKKFLSIIPEYASISVHENNHTFFSKKNNKIDYFPIGLGISDYLLVEYVGKERKIMTIPSFLDLEEKYKISKCLEKIVLNKYKFVERFEYWHGGSFLEIYKLR